MKDVNNLSQFATAHPANRYSIGFSLAMAAALLCLPGIGLGAGQDNSAALNGRNATLTLAATGETKPAVASEPAKNSATAAKKKVESAPEIGTEWKSLFDGITLKGWKPSEFAGHGNVTIEDDQIMMEMGNDMTGITFTNKLPKTNYEVTLDAMRVDGSDFFCGLTFAVKDAPCSLIIGGWGGGVVGLSSINGMDASSNETTTYMGFTDKRWYHVRLRVADARIQAWIDDKSIVNVRTDDRVFSIRIEVEESKPFGIACWRTKAALKDIKIRLLEPAEIKAADEKKY